MGDIHKINVSLLKSYKTDFKSEQSNFSRVAYNSFSSCYVRRCSDPYVSRMCKNLETLYSRISKSYNNIDKWWSDYLTNIEGLENSLSNNGKSGYISESSVRNYVISKLSNLTDISLNLTKMTQKNIKVTNTVKFAANQVTSNMSRFSSLYRGYNTAFSNVTSSITEISKSIVSKKTASTQSQYKKLFSSLKGIFQSSEISGVYSAFNNLSASFGDKFGQIKDDIVSKYQQQTELMNSYMGVLVNPNTTDEEKIQTTLNCFDDSGLESTFKISVAERFCEVVSMTGLDKMAVFDYLIQNDDLDESEKLRIYNYLKNDDSITDDEMLQISSYFVTSCGLSDENTWDIFNYTLDEFYKMDNLPIEDKLSEFMSLANALNYTEEQKKACFMWIVYNENSAEALMYYFQQFDIPEEEQNKEIEKFYKENGLIISYNDNQLSVQLDGIDIPYNVACALNLVGKFSDEDLKKYETAIKTKSANIKGSAKLIDYYCEKNYDAPWYERAGATIVNGFLGLGEGIAHFGEAIWDGATYIGSKVYQTSCTVVLGTFTEYSYKEVWDAYDETAGKEAQKSIEKQHVTDFFNDYVYDTEIGQYLAETGYATEYVRGFSSGVGEVAGTLGLAYFTGGASCAVAGISGFGSGVEEYYASGGTDDAKAFLAGGLSGGVNGFSYWTGQQINNYNPFKGNYNFLKNGALHVGLDATDAFVSSSFLQPGSKALWATGAYDENGVYHEFTDEDNYGDRFTAIFNEQGGWEAVGQNVLLGAGFSAFSESVGIAKYFRKDKNVSATNIVSDVDIDNAKNLLDEYNRLKAIQDSTDYKQYLDDINNGYAHEFNQDFDTLNSKMTSIQKQISELEAKGINFDEITKNTEVSSLDEMISEANKRSGEGLKSTISFDSVNDIPDDFWTRFDNPSDIEVSVNGLKVTNQGVQLNSAIDAAIYFNDSNQYMYQTVLNAYEKNGMDIVDFKSKVGNPSSMDVDYLSAQFNEIASSEQKNIFNNLQKNACNYSQLQKDSINNYTKASGPIITAYLRDTDYHFKGHTVSLDNREALDKMFDLSWRKTDIQGPSIGINHVVNEMEMLIENSTPLKTDLTVYRKVNGLFKDGIELKDVKPGEIFNDSAFVSTSVIQSNLYSNCQYFLEIELPKGTKAAYIETATGTGLYNQQELLLGRNCQFEITGKEIRSVMINGEEVEKVFVKAKLVDSDIYSTLDISFKGTQLSDGLRQKYDDNYFEVYDSFGNYKNDDIPTADLTEVVDKIKTME